MAKRVLVTVLGKAPKGEYQYATYRFPDGVEFKTAFFGDALLRWMQGHSRSPDKLVILGTRTSMWDAIFELGMERSETVTESLWDTLREERGDESRGAQDETLALAAEELSRAFGREVVLVPIPFCKTEREQIEVVETLANHVSPKDSVTVDITHGLRHLPLLTLVAARYVQQVSEAAIEGVYYGMFEAKDADGVTPVVDLSGLLMVLDAGEAVVTSRDSGRMTPLWRVFGDALERFEQVAWFADLRQIENAREAAKAALHSLRTVVDNPLVRLARREIEDGLKVLADGTPLHWRQLQWGRRALDVGDFGTATSMIREALASAGARGSAGNPEEGLDYLAGRLLPEDTQDFELLRQLRNAIAHGSLPTLKAPAAERARSLLAHPSHRDEMEKIMRRIANRAQNWIETRL